MPRSTSPASRRRASPRPPARTRHHPPRRQGLRRVQSPRPRRRCRGLPRPTTSPSPATGSSRAARRSEPRRPRATATPGSPARRPTRSALPPSMQRATSPARRRRAYDRSLPGHDCTLDAVGPHRGIGGPDIAVAVLERIHGQRRGDGLPAVPERQPGRDRNVTGLHLRRALVRHAIHARCGSGRRCGQRVGDCDRVGVDDRVLGWWIVGVGVRGAVHGRER